MCFFFPINCVGSLLADHYGAIIAILSKNDVPFDVGDVVTVLHCLENTTLLILYMFQIYCLHFCY